MPLVLMTNHIPLFRQLGARAFVEAGLDVLVAPPGASLLDLATAHAPDALFVEEALPGEEAFLVCAAVRAEPSIARTPLVMLVSRLVEPATMRRISDAGFDAVLSLPVDDEVLYEELARLLGLPPTSRPAPTALHVHVTADGAPFSARVSAFSAHGLAIAAPVHLPEGTRVMVDLANEGIPFEIEARVAWSREQGSGLRQTGLTIDAPAAEVALQLQAFALWHLRTLEDGTVEVRIHGHIDEHAAFARLLGRVRDTAKVVFDMRGVDSINAAGARNWCNFITAVHAPEVVFRDCSPAFGLQIAMLPRVLGKGRLLSLQAPARCSRCRRETRCRVDRGILDETGGGCLAGLCACGAQLRLERLPERYFALLR